MLEFTILLFLYSLLFIGEKKIIERKESFRIGIYLTFYALFFMNLFIFSVNSFFFDDSLIMKYSLSNFNMGIVGFFFKSMIPIKYLLLAPSIIVLLLAVSFIDLNKLAKIEPHLKKVFIIIVILSITLFLFRFDSISNIYANTVHERVLEDPRMKISLDKATISQTKYSSGDFDKQIMNYSEYSLPRGQRVLMFVVEQTSYNTFLEEMNEIPVERNFFEIVKPNTHIFTNHYTNNQDSMTAIWTMLNSNFIPFECYMTDWNKYYGFVLGTNNLIDLFNNQGYETHTVASVYASGLIMGIYNWTNVTYIQPGTDSAGFFCPEDFEYEKGCEDNIILEDVKNVIDNSNPNGLFMVQEFIYGHGTSYEEQFHKTRTEYYNEYLLNLYDYMKQNNLLEDTTIVILADHGEKGYMDKSLWNYQTPLMIINSNLKYQEIDGLYSTIDFKDILLSYLQKTELKQESHYVYFVGQTQGSEMGYIENNGDYFIAKSSGEDSFKIRDVNGLNDSEIEEKLKVFVKYQEGAIVKSSVKNYWCQLCDQNARKAGIYN